MSDETIKANLFFPFRLEAAFFSLLHFSRQPTLPDNSQLSISTQLKVVDDEYPQKIQINLRVTTQKEQPIFFDIELIALFSHVKDQPLFSKENLQDFINQQALFMLWPYIVSEVHESTAKLGASPITLKTPHLYNYKPNSAE